MSPIILQVRYFRERKGWSQAELGRRARISHSVISRVEGGVTKTLTLENLEKIADALGVAPGRLLTQPKVARRKQAK